ncbi:multidrug transporter [Streptococcus oralis subsp. tigurinus]|uniref:Multidrug transporter n=1 Tax=Streptococcus oralis subsp. tigurinus TaxID=1077464 RepID=A0A1X0X226_STROR|nr:alpha/beta hydrolase [Streptococcus oralis]ORJ33105.1 multidrug transporter [Streptococcus oralis subsp. tigurinus]
MKFHEFGDKNLPPILLIHGGGSSWWNYLRQARILSKEYRIILPTLNGHGEEYQLDYVSTEDSALEILDYIKANCDGKLFAIGGVSLGGQIAMELLSLDSEIAKKAIIDGSLCIPQPRLAKISIFLVSLFGKLMFNKFSCKLQLSMMNKLYPKLTYPEDLPRTPVKTLVTIYKSYMGCYKLKNMISASKAQVLYIYGEKELNCVKESAKLFHQLHSNTILYEAKGYNHGYLSAYLPYEWIDLVVPFLKSDSLEMCNESDMP